MSRFFNRKKKEEKEEKKEEKEESLLKQLCGDDEKLYDVLASLLYLNPITGISERDLEILIEEAEKSIEEKNYEEAMLNNRLVLDKAIFEVTQNPRENGRYIKVIQDFASKNVYLIEKAKEGVEKNGLTDQAASLEKRIKIYKFIGERIEDVLNVASQFYNEQLVTLGETERREGRREERREAESEERRMEEKEKEKREERRKTRGETGREERKEAEIEEQREERKAKERREARVEERREAESEERRMEEKEKEKREERRKTRGEIAAS